jgi:hypothetical protein
VSKTSHYVNVKVPEFLLDIIDEKFAYFYSKSGSKSCEESEYR